VQIETAAESFFSPEEKQSIEMEADQIYEIELKKLYDSVIDKAKFLIKLVAAPT
jgi:hypothetical protein